MDRLISGYRIRIFCLNILQPDDFLDRFLFRFNRFLMQFAGLRPFLKASIENGLNGNMAFQKTDQPAGIIPALRDIRKS